MKAPAEQVRILAIAHDQMIARLRTRIPYWCTLRASTSISDAVRSIQSRKCDAIVLDPSYVPLDTTMALLNAATDAGVACVLYAASDPQAAIRIVHVIGVVRCELICVGADNEAVLFEHTFRALGSVSAPALVASELSPNFRGLPRAVRGVFVDLFTGNPIPAHVRDFVALTNLTERGLERWCVRQKLASPSRLLVGARIAQAWRPISAGEMISVVAREFGWESPDQFREHFRPLLGMSPTNARERMRTGDFACQLASSLRRPDPIEI